MAKFAQKKTRAAVASPLQTTGVAVSTHEGGSGHLRDPKSELFLLAISNFVREETFYEGAKSRDDRFQALVRLVTKDDPAWVARMIPWLRNVAQMRSASIVALAEYVMAGGPGGRTLVRETLSRPDEPAELLAYWVSCYGKKIPQPIKRGIADAVRGHQIERPLYSESSVLKYDGSGKPWKFADVLNLTHPKAKAPWQDALYGYILNKRYQGSLAEVNMDLLPMISLNIAMRDRSVEERRTLLGSPERLKLAGFTWESGSEFFGKMDAEVWEALIPSMGYMALLRNLRNFTDAGISAASVEKVRKILTDPEQVAKSRQFPLRFFSAYENTSDQWTTAISEALDLSVQNVPELPGTTLILVDRSGSMSGSYSGRGSMANWQSASLFGLALAKKNVGRVDLYAYDSTHAKIPVTKSTSILRTMKGHFTPRGGTNTWQTVNATYTGQGRVIILTDEQAWDHSANANHINAPIYTWNVAGYQPAHMEAARNRFSIGGGLTDQSFILLKVLEESKNGQWPF